MQQLKILAFIIGGLPIAAFLLTLFLTDGAPLKPLAPGEESRPAAATPELPRAKLERHGGVAAAGHSVAGSSPAEPLKTEPAYPLDRHAEPTRVFDRGRDAEVFLTLFGRPPPDRPD